MNISINLEGTLEELSPVISALQATRFAEATSPEVTQQVKSDEETSCVSPEFFRRALERHPLTINTIALLKTFYEAEEQDLLSRKTLCREIGNHTRQKFTDQQLTGLLGSFGRRIHQTPGYNDAPYLDWKQIHGKWHYRLPRELRGVVAEVLRNNPIR